MYHSSATWLVLMKVLHFVYTNILVYTNIRNESCHFPKVPFGTLTIFIYTWHDSFTLRIYEYTHVWMRDIAQIFIYIKWLLNMQVYVPFICDVTRSYKGVTLHIYEYTHVWMRDIAQMFERYKWDIIRIWKIQMSHHTHTNETSYAYECVITHKKRKKLLSPYNK